MQNVDRDIIVIGAGGCGLLAALVASKKGARVLLLEKTDKPGGGTAFSSKGIRAAGSRRQRELKIEDSAALYAEDILRRNNGESDAVLTRRLAENSGRVATFSQTKPVSNFGSASSPSATARSAHTRGKRIKPSPIFSSRRWNGRRISRCASPRGCSRSSGTRTAR
jgi:succinate dehydrogenase/fumarate reductase flavoprotein subunit